MLKSWTQTNPINTCTTQGKLTSTFIFIPTAASDDHHSTLDCPGTKCFGLTYGRDQVVLVFLCLVEFNGHLCVLSHSPPKDGRNSFCFMVNSVLLLILYHILLNLVISLWNSHPIYIFWLFWLPYLKQVLRCFTFNHFNIMLFVKTGRNFFHFQ